MARRKTQSKIRKEPYARTERPAAPSTDVIQTIGLSTLNPIQVPHRLSNSKFKRKGPFNFLGLPLEIRQIVYSMLLCPIGEKLLWRNFQQWIPLGHGYSQNLLLACRQINREAIQLQYSVPISIKGFDLMDIASGPRLAGHAWLASAIRPIKKMKIFFSLVEKDDNFAGDADYLIGLLPELERLEIEFQDKDDWEHANVGAFHVFIERVKKEGIELLLWSVGESGGIAEQDVRRIHALGSAA